MTFHYAIELLNDAGRAIGSVGVTPDWQPAVDWTHFDGVRAGILPAHARTDPGTIEPLWQTDLGAPYVRGFRVRVHAGGQTAVREIPRRYLQRLASETAATLARRLGIAPETDLRWMVTARPAATSAAEVTDDGFAIAPDVRAWPVVDTSLDAFFAAAMRVGTADEQLPVFFPPTVLEETHALARAAGDVETGGALLGRLHRDTAGRRELFVEVTAQLPARQTVATASTITFTAATWAAIQAEIARRGRDEILVGWHHSHCDWCRLRGCPLARRRTCSGANPFFSAEDVHLHTTLFPAGYQVALLVSDSAATGGLTSSLYGWSEGLVAPRSFHVLLQKVSDAHS
jgi:hypothetical protein